METLPFEVAHDLPGWTLFWALLEPTPEEHTSTLAELRHAVSGRVRRERELGTLAGDPTVSALRSLFRAAGTDPTRYRPSSEALLRRLLKGGDLPEIHPMVDLNNCLSASLAVPCCVMAEETVTQPFRLRSGTEGESYDSLKGPFRLDGRPVLSDALGPCDTPITGSRRVMIRPESKRVWLVAYLPREVVQAEAAEEELSALLEAAPVARVVTTAESG